MHLQTSEGMREMKHSNPPFIFAATLVLLAGSAFGQDSVSRNANGGSGLPGDAQTYWISSSQRSSYVVDLRSISSSWGTSFGIAPIAKSGRVTSSRFTATNLSSSISSDVRIGVAYPESSYTLWTAPGGGVNSLENNTSLNSSVPRSGTASVFGLGFMDFEETGSGATAVFTNQITGALAAFDPTEPGRLYVTRYVAAHNNVGVTVADTAQFGYGAVDASGNITFRADGFGSLATTNQLTGDSIFRVRMTSRSTATNSISATGGADTAATDRLLNNDAVTHNAPNILPASIGSRSVVVTPNFTGSLRSETSLNATTSISSHRTGAAEHRGGATVLARPVFSSSVATGAVLARVTSTARTNSISVFGLNSSGGVTGSRLLTLPGSPITSCDSYVPPVFVDFRSYDSQVTFRGGSAPVAVGVDSEGRALAAATVYNGTAPEADNPFNAIAVARFDPSNPSSTVSWTLAAWVDSNAMTGKAILGDVGADGAPGTGDSGEGDGVINGSDAPAGRLAALMETTLGLAGPSMSSPAMDAAGNVYFISSMRANRRVGSTIVSEPSIGLVRAVYDPAAYCYRLELLCKVGDVIAGVNSGRNYKIVTLNVADSDSVSSASMWSGSVSGTGWNGDLSQTADPVSPVNLGGLIVSARVVYDTNNDGNYEDPSATGGNTASVDEAYNVALYMGNVTLPTQPCPADWDGSGGVDGDDVIAFFSEWDLGNADFNQDGGTDGDDVIGFFSFWDTGC